MDTDMVAQTSATSRKPSGATPALQPPLASLLSRLCGKSPTNLSNPGFGTPRVPFAARKTSNSERGQERAQQVVAEKRQCRHERTAQEQAQGFKGWYSRGRLPHLRSPGPGQS